MMRISKGFSLIELLVAISIIAILSALGLSVYQAVYKSARDAQRKSDLKMIQSALEQYRSDQMSYPDQITPDSPIVVGSKTYLSKVPKDPKPGQSYSYEPSCDASSCTSYCLFAQLENDQGIINDTGCTPVSPRNYGVTKP